jgi:hypothetical protein
MTTDKPDVAFVIPTWNRYWMLQRSIESLVNQDYEGKISVLVVDDQSTDGTVDLVNHWTEIAKQNSRPREVHLKMGPGRSNWRPGSIHKPFFDLCLSTYAHMVGYQFSDDYCDKDRIRKQVEGTWGKGKYWSFCERTHFVDTADRTSRVERHRFERSRAMLPATGPTLPVYGFLVSRENFISVGGCDEPERAGACAEAWIIAHCGMMLDPYVADTAMYFRVHGDALGAGQKPGSKTYKESVKITGFKEEDHWRLWREIEPKYLDRVARALIMKGE